MGKAGNKFEITRSLPKRLAAVCDCLGSYKGHACSPRCQTASWGGARYIESGGCNTIKGGSLLFLFSQHTYACEVSPYHFWFDLLYPSSTFG